MNNSRTVFSKGFLFNDNRAATHLSSTQQPWKFVPVTESCAQCCACGQVNEDIVLDMKTIMTAGLLAEIGTGKPVIPVYFTMRNETIPLVLWHTLLFPLTGFVLGALAGYNLLYNDVAAVSGSLIGLILATLCTHSLKEQRVVSIEKARDFTTSEISNR